jgi:hypothetical protein
MKTATLGLALIVSVVGISTVMAGTVCVAPAAVDPLALGNPSLGLDRQGSNQPLGFTISVGDKPAVAASTKQSVLIRDIPTNKPQMVVIRQNGRPYTAFPLRFSEHKSDHVCLWLNDLYLTWSVWPMSWSRGTCKCEQ